MPNRNATDKLKTFRIAILLVVYDSDSVLLWQ
jgi:hypothetical protein